MTELRQHAILYVDDEAIALKYFDKGFSQNFRILTATSAAEAWQIVETRAGEIGVLMTDQRMPGQTGVELLEKVRRKYPQIIRILVTAHSDIQSAIDAVNEGAIYKYISKPWDVTDLRITLLRALEFFEVLKERDQLVREKLSVLQQIVIADRTKNLGVVAAGLTGAFRQPLKAATEFIAAAPRRALEGAALPERGTVVRSLQTSIEAASGEIFELANTLSAVAAGPNDFGTESFSVEELLRQVAEEHPSGGGAAAVVEMSEARPVLKGNRRQLETLFRLVTRSLQAAHGSSVTVTFAIAQVDDAGHPALRIRLNDSQPEWDMQARRRLFAPFGSVSREGRSGLDLAACYILIYHHGGRVTLPGTADAKLELVLPLDPASSEPDSPTPSQLAELFHHEQNWDAFWSHKS